MGRTKGSSNLAREVERHEKNSFQFIGMLLQGTDFEDAFWQQGRDLAECTKMIKVLYFTYGRMGGDLHDLQESKKK